MKWLIVIFGVLSLQAQSRFVDSDGSKIHYQTFGDGKPILIINGGPGMSSRGFVPLAEKLSETHRTIIFDQRGTGWSLYPANAKTITMDKMVGDIETLRQHLKIDSWTVLGHSFGGMLASYYATKHPKRIDKLILSASGGIDLSLTDYVSFSIQSKLSDKERDSLRYFNNKIASGDTTYAARIGRGRALAPAYVYDKKNAPIIAKRLTEGNSEVNNLVWSDMRRIGFNCAPKLKTFTNPVLVIHGKNDILKRETAQRSQNAFPNAQLVEIENCGHYGWLDNPTAYFNSIRKFLMS